MASRPHPTSIQGRQALQRVISALRRDHQEARRLLAALDRHRTETGSFVPYERMRRDTGRLVQHLESQIQVLGTDLERRDEDAAISHEVLREFARQRRGLHRLLQQLPSHLFAGLEVEGAPPAAAAVAKVERKALPAAADLESALLLLPTPWLKAMRDRHEALRRATAVDPLDRRLLTTRPRAHRARTRIAAWIADGIHHPEVCGPRLDGALGRCTESQCTKGRDALRLLALLVIAGRLPVTDLSPAEQAGLAVPLEWAQAAPGPGGTLRQLGLAFVGRAGGRATVAVPDDVRPPLAHVLEPRLRAFGAPADLEAADRLAVIAEPEAARLAREAFHCEGIYEEAEARWLPTRLARLRRRTPGPDRVLEIELGAEDTTSPVTRRILISYQRTVGALREMIQLALGWEDDLGRIFAVPGGDSVKEPFRVWLDPAGRFYDVGSRDEWASSIRDAVATSGKRLHYVTNSPPPKGCHSYPRYTLRVVRVHAPERVAAEPRVIWGEGVADAPARIPEEKLQASLDAANVLLERLAT